MTEYTSANQARQAARIRYEADYPQPPKPTPQPLARPQVIRVGTGRLWIEVETRYYATQGEPEINLFFTGRAETNKFSLEEVDALIGQLQAAKRNYEGVTENNQRERAYQEANQRWEEGREKAERRAYNDYRKSQEKTTHPDSTETEHSVVDNPEDIPF